MTANDSKDREAFYGFVEGLRMQTFSMYERIREVQRAPDSEMERRLQLLGEVGSAASEIFGQVESLYACVWSDSQRSALPNFEVLRQRERALAGVL